MRTPGVEAIGRSARDFDWLSAISRARELDAASAAGSPGLSPVEPVRRGRNHHMSGRPSVDQRNCLITDLSQMPPRSKSVLRV